MEISKAPTVLFLGSLERKDGQAAAQKQTDEIDFGSACAVQLIRIPNGKQELYNGRLVSITQVEPIKNFEVYFRNLKESSGRFTLLTANNQLMTTANNDLMISPTELIYTDLIVVRGHFSKLSLVVYGNVLEQATARHYLQDVPVNAPTAFTHIQRNIFKEKSQQVFLIQRELQQSGNQSLTLANMDSWHQVNDDDINEPQIKNISNISQHLLNTFSQQIHEDHYVVKFRENIENINNLMAKIFKSKQIGLYYPREQNTTVANEIPIGLVDISLQALSLLLSDQNRVLDLLKMLAQLPKHSKHIIESRGIFQITRLFIDCYSPKAVFFSSFKNLLLQVLIALSHWNTGAHQMVIKLQQNYYYHTFEKYLSLNKTEKQERQEERERERSTSRSRQKEKTKAKKSKDSQEEDQSPRKKDKKDRRSKKEKSKEKQRSKKKQKEKKKIKEEKAKKQQVLQVIQKKESFVEPKQDKICERLSLYEMLHFIFLRQKNSKTLTLVKILIEQITQTLTKNSEVSEMAAQTTSYLRDTKNLFNPGIEIINSKYLRIFATFQPFLNEYQSQNAHCRFIAQKQKIKFPEKYEINPKIFMILNKINLLIISSLCKEISSPFDESFMTMMSALILEKQKPIMSGFSRIVDSFKVENLLQLKKYEASISIMAEYIYKALLEDEGYNTILYFDQIHASLIKITSYLNQDPTLFSSQLKVRIRMLSNYIIPYDEFSKSEGIFKPFCEYFLKIFKYENYSLEMDNKAKIFDFRKKEYEKLINPYSFENLLENYSLKNFIEVSKSQPILQIDVCLKIFLLLSDYNKNIWTTFYENRLISGLSSLLTKLSSVLLFMISPCPQKWTNYAKTKNHIGLVDNYLTVIKHILTLLARKGRYEAAFNDLLQEDIFEDVQVYEKTVSMYLNLYVAYSDPSSMMYVNKTLKNMKEVMAICVEVLDQFLFAYELIPHDTREKKLNRILEILYVKHYQSIILRPAVLSLYAHIIRFTESNSCKAITHLLLDKNFSPFRLIEAEVGFIPQNDKCMMENVIISNIYRNDSSIRSSLAFLSKWLLTKNIYNEKVNNIIERIFDEFDEQIKYFDECEQYRMLLKKLNLFILFIVESNCKLRTKLQEKLFKLYKNLKENIRKKLVQKEDHQSLVSLLRSINNLMIYFKKMFPENEENSNFLTFIKITSKCLNLENYIPSESEQIKQLNYQYLQSCRNFLDVLVAVGKKSFYQCLLLYGEFMQNPYKPDPLISFVNLLIFSESEKYYFLRENQKQHKQFEAIICSMMLFLVQLTTINREAFFSTESRRNAIIFLVSLEKQFPFSSMEKIQQKVKYPLDLLNLIVQYFNFPIIQSNITLPQKKQTQQNKPLIAPIKSKLFSKSMFSLIGEHEQINKARYKFVSGEWVSGDVSRHVYSPFRPKFYDQQVERHLTAAKKNAKQFDFLKNQVLEEDCGKQALTYNELFVLFNKKELKQIPKNIIAVINLVNVKNRTKPLYIPPQHYIPAEKRISPIRMSPAKVNLSQLHQENKGLISGARTMSAEKQIENRRSNSNPRNMNPPYNPPHQNYPYSHPAPAPSNPLAPPSTAGNYNSFKPPVGGFPPGYYYPPQQHHGNSAYRYSSNAPTYNPSMFIPPQNSHGYKPVYNTHPGGFAPQVPHQSILSYQEQFQFNEAVALINQLKNSSNKNEEPIKKTRLNQILTNPKIHMKVKNYFENQ